MNILRLVVVSLLLTVALYAQDETPLKITNQNRTGELPFSTQIGSDIEHVDVASGSLNVKIPIASIKGRGMDFNFGLRYTSGFWVTATRLYSSNPGYQEFTFERRNGIGGVGWEPNQAYLTWVNSKGSCGTFQVGGRWVGTGEPISYFSEHSNYIYHDENGAKHPLAVRTGAGGCDNGGYVIEDLNGPDLTGAGVRGIITDGVDWTPNIYVSDGTQVAWSHLTGNFGPGTVVPYNYEGNFLALGDFTDSNGNQLSQKDGGQDTLGRVLLARINGSNQITYTYSDSDGVPRDYIVNIGSQTYATAFNATGAFGAIIEASGTAAVITSIVLPNNQVYSFQYESGSYLGLTRVDLPTGAYITYTWATLADQDHPQRYVNSRTVHSEGQTFTWNISRVCIGTNGDPCDQVKTTVTDPLGNQSVYVSVSGAVRSAKIYSGTATGTPLRQYDLVYQEYFDPINDNAEARDLLSITTTLENGQVSKKEFTPETFTYQWQDCDSGDLNTCAQLQANGQQTYTTYTATRGNVLSTREYDWGQGAPGPLIRTTVNTYLHNSNSSYGSTNIVSKIDSISVFEGASTLRAKTLFEYDNNGSATLTDNNGATISSYPVGTGGSVPGHDNTNFSSSNLLRGNVTKVKKWRNTDGGYSTSIYSYDDLGNILSITDADNHRTSYSYTDSWPTGSTACQPSANTYAFVTQVTNALGHHLEVKRYSCTGLVQSHRDQNDINNSRLGTTYTYDSMGRVLQQTENFTGGGQITYSYNDLSLPLSKTVSKKRDGSGNLITTVSVLDGLGRVKQTQLTTDPQGSVYTDSTYDPLGRVIAVTNPHRTALDSTSGITRTVFDALGRVCKSVPPDNTTDPATSCASSANTVVTTYLGNSTTVTDQAGKQRRTYTDALARLVQLDEPGMTLTGGTPGTAGSGTVSISGGEQTVPEQTATPVAGTGSVSITGTEQSKQVQTQAATASTGNVTVTGTEQSKQVQTQAATAGTGTVTINGAEQSTTDPDILCPRTNPNCNIVWDFGSVSISVNGLTKSVNYGQNSTASSLAISLAAGFNNDASSSVTAVVSGSTITFSAKTTGATTNYSLSSSSATNSGSFFSPSFTTSQSGSTLTGGANAVFSTVYDTGTVSVTVNGFTASANYVQGSTGSTIASAIAGVFNGNGASPVTASASGATVYMTTKSTGASTHYALSSSSQTTNTNFSSASFGTSNSGAALTSGADAVFTTVYDSGNVSITVNGFTKTTSFGQGSTASTIASSLSSAFNADAASPVTSSASGGTVSLTSKATGTASNYSLSTSSSYDGANFTSASFSSSASGSTLTGGSEASFVTVYDSGTVTISISGSNYSVNYGQGSTTSSIASALASTVSAGTLANASASGSTVTLTAKSTGSITNYALSASSTYNTAKFSSPSFTGMPSGSTMTGGTNATPGTPTWSLSTPYVTKYSYDVLGNLTCVEQQGMVSSTGCSSAESSDSTSLWRVRRFTYDSLSRLLTAKNPEAGKICYGIWSGTNCINGYDSVGNLLKKTDARNITITYTYDALNRLAGKSYGNGDPAVTYSYDQTTFNGLTGADNVGRRTGMVDASGTTGWMFDPAGRILAERRSFTVGTSTVTKVISTTYNPDGSPSTLTYPSGMVLNYSYNGAAQPISAIDGSGNKYFSDALYWPGGALQSSKRGTTATFAGITTSDSYNSRLQPVTLSATAPAQPTVISLTYDFQAGIADNGNVKTVTNDKSSDRTATFTYDGLNRLETAYTPNAGTWGNTFSYDPWGNLNKMLAYSNLPEAQHFDQTSNGFNQIVGFCYDAAGNYNSASTCAGGYTYNAENQIISAGGVTYTYDGDGTRVMKSNGTLYWGAGVVAESDLTGAVQREFVLVGGKRIARRDLSTGAIYYYFSDHLGSSNVVTDALGVIKNESDYYPYGGERVITNTLANQNYKFTGKERDSESGLDYFGARYYGSNFGRWLSPDWSETPVPVPFADLSDPQTLNLYGYVRNNPLSRADADGHCPDGCPDPATVPKTVEQLNQQNQANADFFVGVGKGLVNLSTSMMNAFITMGESGSTPIPQFQPSNDIQAVGMVFGAGIGTLTSLGAEAPAVSTIEQNAAKGAASESRVLNSIGETKNTQAVSASEGKSIPDFQNSKVVGEIKDAKTVSNTRQLRIQKEAAQQSGREHQLVTGNKTQVTNNAAQGTKVIRRDDLGPK